jgi:hypothetical protein
LTRRRPHPTLGIPHNPVGDDPRHRGCAAVQPARRPASLPLVAFAAAGHPSCSVTCNSSSQRRLLECSRRWLCQAS